MFHTVAMSLFGHVHFSLNAIILPLRLTGTHRVLCSSCRLYSLHCLSQLCYGAELVVLGFSCTDRCMASCMLHLQIVLLYSLVHRPTLVIFMLTCNIV